MYLIFFSSKKYVDTSMKVLKHSVELELMNIFMLKFEDCYKCKLTEKERFMTILEREGCLETNCYLSNDQLKKLREGNYLEWDSTLYFLFLNAGLRLLVKEEYYAIEELRGIRNEIIHSGVSGISYETFYRYVNGISRAYVDLKIPFEKICKLNKLTGD